MSTNQKLGTLAQVELRDVWKKEDTDFTPWLARPDHITAVGNALNIELEVQAEEHPIGPFKADIYCLDLADGSPVLIENQLERTDHTHLGQLLTYAAGLEAVTIIWIAKKFTDEHRAALDWLNQNDQKDSNILILLDLNMPEINGWQFLDKLQETSYQSTIWVALVTSSSDLEDKERSLHYKQVVAYLEKPVKQGELLKLKSIPALQSFF
jgi:CheY-like chemotaxis protein